MILLYFIYVPDVEMTVIAMCVDRLVHGASVGNLTPLFSISAKLTGCSKINGDHLESA